MAPAALTGGGRRLAISQARAGIAYVWVECLGQSGRALAPWLGLHPATGYKAARRGAGHAAVWEHLLAVCIPPVAGMAVKCFG